MFEKILEKILLQYFGRFITGLDKNNLKLGVWSGNMVIENVNLKPEIIEMLELPIKIEKSQIGKMRISIPWKKLSSAPVEITIEDVYVTLVPLKEWVFDDKVITQQKLQGLLEYCKKCMKKGIKKKSSDSKDKEKDKGYLDKMGIKIMDNIQLRIANIHIRYDSTYAWGITLETLDIFTTNESWQPSFIDRTEKNIEKIYKLFSLKNLAFYWNTENEEQIDQQYQKFMDERILKANMSAKEFCTFILIINAEMKVIQNETSIHLPLKDISLILEEINLLLKKEQFQQIVHMFENFSQYSKMLWISRKRQLNQQQDQQDYQKIFAILFPKVQQGNIESLSQNEQDQFNSIIRSIDYNILLDWVSLSAKSIVKETKLNKATNEKIKKETAWWKTDKKQAGEINLTEEEIIAINQKIDKIFQDEKQKLIGRPEDSINYKFQFTLNKGRLRIESHGEGLQLIFLGLQMLTESRANESYDIIFRLQNVSLDLIIKDSLQHFCYKSQGNQNIDQLMKIHFQQHPKNQKQDASLMIQLDPIECKYDTEFLKKWNDFFNIEDLIENAVQVAAHEKLNNLQNQTATSLTQIMNSEYKLAIFIQIASPKILLQHWIINLGNLNIYSDSESQLYDLYTLELKELSLQSGNLDIIHKLETQFTLERIKGIQKQTDKPRIVISGMIPPIELKLTEQLQKELLQIDSWIFPQKSEDQKLRQLKKEKDFIIKNQQWQGNLQRKENYLWQKCYGILSGSFLYFYKKEHDLRWEDRILLKDTKVIEQNEEIILQHDRILYLRVDEGLKQELLNQLDKDEDGPIIQNIDQSLFQVQLKLSKFKLHLLKENEPLYQLVIEDMYYRSHKTTNQLCNSIILGNIFIEDFVHKFDDPQLQYLFKKLDDYQDAILTIENKIENSYAHTQINFGKFILNWKPATYLQISALSKLIQKAFGIEVTNLEDDEVEQLLHGESNDQILQYKLAKLLSNQINRNYNSLLEKYKDNLYTRDNFEKNIEQMSKLFINCNSKLVQKVDVSIEEVAINLIHRQSHILIGQLKLNDMKHTVDFTQIAKFMQGDIGTLYIYDLSNYPKTLQQLSSVQILQMKNIHYDYALYNKDLINNPDEIISSFTMFNIEQMDLQYQHQQINRFQNYLFIQIIQLIVNTQSVTMNDGLEKPKMVCGNIEQLFHSFMNPQFMLYEYRIQNLRIDIKKFYSEQECLTILIKQLIYKNKPKIESDRLHQITEQYKLPLWVDEAHLTLVNYDVAINNQIISSGIEQQLTYKKVLFENEMKELFDLKIRNTIEIISHIEKIDLELTRSQFICLCTIMAYNLLFNDDKDDLFIHDNHIYKQFTPIEMRALLNVKYGKFKLQQENSQIILNTFQIEYFLAQNLNKTINLFSNQFNINYGNDQIFESQLKQNCFQQDIQFIQPFNYLTQTKFHKDGRPNINGFALKIDYLITKTSKELIIDLEDNQIIAQTKAILNLLNFIDLDDKCFPPEDIVISKKQVIMLNWKGILLFPGINTKEDLVSRGGINFILEKYKNIISQKITVTNLEFFICPLNELFEFEFSEVAKRHILLPTYAYIGYTKQEQNQLDFSIDHLKLQISYEDLEPLYGAFLYQNKQLEKSDNNQIDQNILFLINAQIYYAEITFIQFQDCPVPLFQFITKDFQLSFTQRCKYIMNWQSIFQASFFNLTIGGWEPMIEPLYLLGDTSYDQNGNPRSFTSLQINESTDIPMNINLTKDSIKQLLDLQRRWEQSIKKVESGNIQNQRSPSRISRNSSIIQSAIEKVAIVSPYILDNQTGYDIELTIINQSKKTAESFPVQQNQQLGLKFVDKIDRRTFSIFIKCEDFIFKDLNQLQFHKNRDESRILDFKIGMLNKQSIVLVRINASERQKVMIISSETQFQNNCEDIIEIKLIHKLAKITKNIILLQGNSTYLPLGFEQSMIQVRYQKTGVWSQLMEMQKLITKDGNYNLFSNTPSLVLSVQKAAITTQPLVILFQCPFSIHNQLLIPIDIYFTIDQWIRIEPKQYLKISNAQLSKGIKFKIKLPAFQKSPQLEVNDQFKGYDFQIRDYLGIELNLLLIRIQNESSLISVAIDGGMTIQNSLGMSVFMYSLSQQQQMFYQPGQPIYQVTEQEDELRQQGCIQIININEFIILSFEQGNIDARPKHISQPLNVSQIGQYIIQVPKEEEGFMEVVVDVQQFYGSINQKVISFTPRYIIFNKLKTNLTIQQDRCKQDSLIIPQSKMPLQWHKNKGTQFLKFKIKDAQSGCVSTEMQGTTTLPLRNAQGFIIDYLNVTCMEEDKTKYIIIQEQNQKPLYRIFNNLKYDISFYQSDIQELNDNIKTKLPRGQSIDYALDNPGFKRMLTLELYKNSQLYDFIKIELVNSQQQTLYQLADEDVFYVNSQFSLQNKQMYVTLSEHEIENQKQLFDNIQNQLSIMIPKLNISFINVNPREELVVFSFQQIEFIQLSDVIETFQLRIQDLQIDNNQSYRCIYPVLAMQLNQKANIPFLSLLVRRAHEINFINYFESVQLSIQPFILKITEGTYSEIESFLKSLKLIEDQQLKPLRPWQLERNLKQQLCFFEKFQLYPLKIQLSFKKAEKKANSQYLKTAASQAVNCDEVNVTIKGFAINSCFTTKEQLEYRLTQNYKDALMANVYKLVGSIDLLGNPVGLIGDVSGGFRDLIEMPYDGFVQGPLEGGLGIVKGVGSLTKGVVSGTFNTVSKITGSVASGLSQLSMDDDYLNLRQQQNAKKAKTVVHGFGQGMVSLFQGVGMGIAGLVIQPYQGAESEGVEGFFKGFSKGLAGLVVKPVAGALDFVSKTSEGVKNTANFFDEKPNETRKRLPRVFYGREQIFKNYMLQDSEVMYILEKLQPGLLLIDTFAFMITKYKFAYVITVQQFILLEIFKKQILVSFNNDNLKGYEIADKEVRIYLFNQKIIYKERAKQKAFIEQRKESLIVRQADKLIHQFLETKLQEIQSIIHNC